MKNEESGQALILVALMMAVLMGFAALVVDAGMMYSERSSLQSAADASALAGAQDLPDAGKAKTAAFYIAELNTVLNSETTPTTPYNSDSTKIEVRMERTLPLIFARFLGIDSAKISARAVAQKSSKWEGDALPFVNLKEGYAPGAEIGVWDTSGPGTFESIWKNEITTFNKSIPSSIYFDIAYEDGLAITQGVVAEGTDGIKSSVQAIYDRVKPSGESVFLLSLSQEVITSGRILVKAKNSSQYIEQDLFDNNGKVKLGNEDVIHKDQLVLLECIFDSFDFNNNSGNNGNGNGNDNNDSDDIDSKLKLKVIQSYTMVGDDVPINYAGPSSKKSKLIE